MDKIEVLLRFEDYYKKTTDEEEGSVVEDIVAYYRQMAYDFKEQETLLRAYVPRNFGAEGRVGKIIADCAAAAGVASAAAHLKADAAAASSPLYCNGSHTHTHTHTHSDGKKTAYAYTYKHVGYMVSCAAAKELAAHEALACHRLFTR